MKPIIIALYLPQFYPTPENDKWWGKGFTEWTNVGKAKSLFKGHDQPRVPTELGYYDLRIPEIRQKQAEMAKEAGVSAFCYWHYWFGDGKRLLSDVFDEVLSSGSPDFPFCLGWANHSWYAKAWNKESKDKLLMEQTYPGIEDEREHFKFLLKAFNDRRYLKIDGKPFLLIYQPDNLPSSYVKNLRQWTKDAGFNDLFLVANTFDRHKKKSDYLNHGYDAVHYNYIANVLYDKYEDIGKIREYIDRLGRYIRQILTGKPRGALNYAKYYKCSVTEREKDIDVIPQIFPQWDHSPRSQNNAAAIYYNSTPEIFKKQALQALECVKEKPEKYQILILKSWNEWGEGNYMEPDLTNGRGYIDALRDAISEVSNL